MPGSLARMLSKHLWPSKDIEAMERSMKHHEGWVKAFLDDLGDEGPYVLADMIESLCSGLDICQQKLEIERGKNDWSIYWIDSNARERNSRR